VADLVATLGLDLRALPVGLRTVLLDGLDLDVALRAAAVVGLARQRRRDMLTQPLSLSLATLEDRARGPPTLAVDQPLPRTGLGSTPSVLALLLVAAALALHRRSRTD
jgi:hypothetical protein